MTAPSKQPNAEFAEVSQSAQSDHVSRLNELSQAVIGAAVEVQRILGTGSLESAFAAALAVEFLDRGLTVEREWPVQALYKGHPLGVAYRADFLVEGQLLVELKALEMVTPAHRAQVLSYLRVADIKLGLLINFHSSPLVNGVYRVVNKL